MYEPDGNAVGRAVTNELGEFGVIMRVGTYSMYPQILVAWSNPLRFVWERREDISASERETE